MLVRIYGHITLPPLTLKGGHWLRVLGSRVLRKIIGPEVDVVKGVVEKAV